MTAAIKEFDTYAKKESAVRKVVDEAVGKLAAYYKEMARLSIQVAIEAAEQRGVEKQKKASEEQLKAAIGEAEQRGLASALAAIRESAETRLMPRDTANSKRGLGETASADGGGGPGGGEWKCFEFTSGSVNVGAEAVTPAPCSTVTQYHLQTHPCLTPALQYRLHKASATWYPPPGRRHRPHRRSVPGYGTSNRCCCHRRRRPSYNSYRRRSCCCCHRSERRCCRRRCHR